jgi:hypothetical protein
MSEYGSCHVDNMLPSTTGKTQVDFHVSVGSWMPSVLSSHKLGSGGLGHCP